MLNFNELWIGERLRLIDSGQIGYFEGISSEGLIILSVDHIIRRVKPENLQLAPEEKIDLELSFNDEFKEDSFKNFKSISNTIDLHIETLDPSLMNAQSERILRRQIEAFHIFMKSSIQFNLPHLLIIHGKGEGVLRQEIQFLLKSVYKAKIISTTNQDGATEVWM